MRFRKALVALSVLALAIVVPSHRAQGRGPHIRHYHVPAQTNTQSSATSTADTSGSSTNLFPPITSYYPPLPYPLTNKTHVAAAAAPLDPEAEAKRKAELAARTLTWHREQAEQGSAYGQYQMGMHYLNGDGVPKDLQRARDWFLKSAKQGNDDAYQKLKNLDYPSTVQGADGQVLQSASAHTEFMTQSGYAKGRLGYVIDHKTPISAGGSDTPDNLQWAKIADARKNEKWDDLEALPAALDSTASHSSSQTTAAAQ
jgi:Sel1 repeat